jgi:hypothetical protein
VRVGLGVVADDGELVARRQRGSNSFMRSHERVDDRDAVLARLLADRQHDRRLAGDAGGGLRLLLAVDDGADVAHQDRVALDAAHDDLLDAGTSGPARSPGT